MTGKSARARRPRGHLALLAGFIVFVVWYLTDSIRASDQITNLLLIGPVSVLALAIAAGLLLRVSREEPLPPDKRNDTAAPAPRERAWRHRYGPLASMIAMVVYVGLLPWVGFDLATSCFVAANMWIYGERNPVLIMVYSVFLGIVVSATMKHLLFVPIPTLLPL